MEARCIMDFFITRGDKTHGPCAERELRTYLAYGSLKPEDLVRRADEEEWFPVKMFPEFASVLPETPTKSSRWLPDGKPRTPKRIMRFRDLRHVPLEQRAGRVIWRLLSGFLCRPLTLWRTAAVVFTSSIYRGAKDGSGFLRTWPRWVETPVTILILLHAVMWTGFVFWAVPRAKPFVRAVVESADQAWKDAFASQEGLPPVK